MAEFDKAKFIKERVASTAKICAGVLGEDSLEIVYLALSNQTIFP